MAIKTMTNNKNHMGFVENFLLTCIGLSTHKKYNPAATKSIGTAKKVRGTIKNPNKKITMNTIQSWVFKTTLFVRDHPA